VELREILTALRYAWWLPVIGLALGGGVALTMSQLQTPMYTSFTQLFVSTTDSGSTTEALSGSQLSQQRVTSYARLIAGEELASRVVDRLDLNMTSSELASEIEASVVTNTVLIDVTVTDSSPERARRIADSVGAEFAALAAELETPDASGTTPVKVTVTQQARAADEASSPKTVQNVLIGSLTGLLIGAALAVARLRLDRTVKDVDEAADLAEAPVIGTIIRDEVLVKRHVVVGRDNTRTVEDYRQLRTNLQFLDVDRPPRVIMVSSAVPSEGKTTVVVNLALALGEAGRRVTVIEADLRRPKVARYMGLVGGAGLTNILAGAAEVHEVVQSYGDGHVSVIASGPTPPNPGELLSSRQMSELIDKLRLENDFLLVDAPPLLPVADATGLAAAMDGVLLSVRYGSTTKAQLRQAAKALQRVNANTLGVILNIVPPKAGAAAAYGYGYSYESTAPSGKHKKAAERQAQEGF
jgi:capsular exopolysaccharide synthesis family protein